MMWEAVCNESAWNAVADQPHRVGLRKAVYASDLPRSIAPALLLVTASPLQSTRIAKLAAQQNCPRQLKCERSLLPNVVIPARVVPPSQLHSSYLACAVISEFESSHPSHVSFRSAVYLIRSLQPRLNQQDQRNVSPISEDALTTSECIFCKIVAGTAECRTLSRRGHRRLHGHPSR
jgi:hypothetical protein